MSKQIVTVAILSSLLAAGTAGAAPLPCVQRAIDWANASPDHDVQVTMVALHEVGIAAYAKTSVVPSLCAAPLAFTGCLGADAAADGLLSNKIAYTTTDTGGGFGTTTAQPFDISQPLPLTLTQLRNNSSYLSQINSGSTIYSFTASCVGNLVVGNDQYGNHWTLALELLTAPAPPR